MKNIHLIVLSVLVLCGCSKHHEIPARNLVVAGKDIVWHGSGNEDSVMRIAKREGDSLEGIHVIYRGHPGGPPATITADKGTILPRSDRIDSNGITYTNTVTIVLKNARFQTDKKDEVIEDLHMDFRP
jgi:hypothetical protein